MTNQTCPLSVIIITRNEERNIRECLMSVNWANDIIVVDSQSIDHTVAIAREFTNKVFVRPWDGFVPAKKFALEQCSNEWVLWLDADERVTPELAGEIQQAVTNPSPSAAYDMARRAYFLGKWIKHCGWYPGFVVRLFRKSSAHFVASHVHERLEVNGTVARFQHDLLHFTDKTLDQYFLKFNHYTTLAARDLRERGKKFSLLDLLIHPPFVFVKMFILRGGFLDGTHGFILSVLSSCYVFTKYAKLWHIERELVPKNSGSGRKG